MGQHTPISVIAEFPKDSAERHFQGDDRCQIARVKLILQTHLILARFGCNAPMAGMGAGLFWLRLLARCYRPAPVRGASVPVKIGSVTRPVVCDIFSRWDDTEARVMVCRGLVCEW